MNLSSTRQFSTLFYDEKITLVNRHTSVLKKTSTFLYVVVNGIKQLNTHTKPALGVMFFGENIYRSLKY